MLTYIWTVFLYQPVFNALIWIYSNFAGKNMGWAVVWLTVGLRIILLPLTIASERNAFKEVLAEAEAEAASKAFKFDPVARKEIFRRIIKKNKISPWAKVATLAIQLLVFILLYQVFVRGMSGEKIIKFLYPVVEFPGKINNMFYGFDISRIHDGIWAGIAAGYMFCFILIENRRRKHWTGAEFIFLIAFPAFTFVALWILPMVKSLFILTSMVFSDIITLLRKLFFPIKKPKTNH
ncbi:MAG: YidC/Oxa1 family membrane protein insertase [bacterium]|nr:YidC/Oxa1 family membrane protein insertase [bacterium]